MMDKIIQLTPSEIMQAAMVGVMRSAVSIQNGYKHNYGAQDKDTWQIGIEGALGECALAKYKNVYWKGMGIIRSPDVGDEDVRTAWRDNSHLIVHPADPDNRKFWLVTGLNGKYIIRGWILGKDAKKQEYWKDMQGTNRPAYFVPQSALINE